MSYISLKFLVFVLVAMAVYFLFPFKKQKWTVLLAASYVFYLFAGYKYVAYLLFTTVSTWFFALRMDEFSAVSGEYLKQHKSELSREEKKKYKDRIKKKKRRVLTLALALNFGILAFLKYYNFFAGSLSDIMGSFGIPFSAPELRLLLPLGISFYTFQSMGYLVDVYRGDARAQKNLFKFVLFVSFFPQIIQGPIGIYNPLAQQLYEPHRFDFTRFKHGTELILWGLAKKMIIADHAVIAINMVTADYDSYGGMALTFTILLYALQLYADFSGGIDVSRGVAQIFGIDLMENFRRPYFSKNISEYWRRWHISLGNWFKNYLFYPLAMSPLLFGMGKKIRASKFGETKAGAHIAKTLPTALASFLVFFTVGIWHGADWKYVGFGVWNGGVIMLSALLAPVFVRWQEKLHIDPKAAWYIKFQIFRTFLVILVGYVFDVAPSFGQAMRTFALAFTDWNIAAGMEQIAGMGLCIPEYVLLLVSTVFLFRVSQIQERNGGTTIRAMLDERPFIVRWLVLYFGILALVIFGVYGPGYNPADFVYMQF